jgi:hypothetical protein
MKTSHRHSNRVYRIRRRRQFRRPVWRRVESSDDAVSGIKPLLIIDYTPRTETDEQSNWRTFANKQDWIADAPGWLINR